MHGTGTFIPVAGAKFRQTQRQVAIAFQALIVDLHMAGTVHRLKGIGPLFIGMLFINLGDEHVFAVFFPMARGLPKLAVNNLGSLDFLISSLGQATAHVVFQCPVDGPAIGVPEHHAGGLFLNVKQVHGTAKFPVVTLFGLFKHVQMGLQIFFILEGDSVDALQHFIV